VPAVVVLERAMAPARSTCQPTFQLAEQTSVVAATEVIHAVNAEQFQQNIALRIAPAQTTPEVYWDRDRRFAVSPQLSHHAIDGAHPRMKPHVDRTGLQAQKYQLEPSSHRHCHASALQEFPSYNFTISASLICARRDGAPP
jgi:hypothetical protein